MNLCHSLFLLAVMMAMVACRSVPREERIGPLSSVTRAQSLRTAERYTTHQWTGQKEHIHHGEDPGGVQVDTPDAGYSAVGHTPGWWKPGVPTEGVPYCWGGFDTPELFDAGLRAGKWAGDVYTSRKRARLEAGHSPFTAGVDCSGFVSRCWNLEWHCSTRSIPKICDLLPSYDSLRSGDALSTYNGHVLLFAGFMKADKSELLVYETGSPLGWRVMKHTTPAWFLRGQGFEPYRYRGMKEG